MQYKSRELNLNEAFERYLEKNPDDETWDNNTVKFGKWTRCPYCKTKHAIDDIKSMTAQEKDDCEYNCEMCQVIFDLICEGKYVTSFDDYIDLGDAIWMK